MSHYFLFQIKYAITPTTKIPIKAETAGVGTPGVGVGVPDALDEGKVVEAMAVADAGRGVAVVSFITSDVGEGANVGEGITVVAGVEEGVGAAVGVGVIVGVEIGDIMITDVVIVELGSGLKEAE